MILQKAVAAASADFSAGNYTKAVAHISSKGFLGLDYAKDVAGKTQDNFMKNSYTAVLQDADAKSTPMDKVLPGLVRFTNALIDSEFEIHCIEFTRSVHKTLEPESYDKPAVDQAASMVKKSDIGKCFRVFETGSDIMLRAAKLADATAAYDVKVKEVNTVIENHKIVVQRAGGSVCTTRARSPPPWPTPSNFRTSRRT